MVSNCVAEKCKNHSGYRGRPATKKGLTYHRFPLKNPDICDIWTRNCGREKGWKPTRHSYLCSEHFSKDCYEEDMYLKIMGKPRSGRSQTALKPGTLPTLFQHEATVQTRYECASRPLTERKLLPKEEKQPDRAQPYNVLALQPMMTSVDTLLPSTYSVAPESIANVNQNPIAEHQVSTLGQITAIDSGEHQADVSPALSAPNIALNTTSVTDTTEDAPLKGDQAKGQQFAGNRDTPETPREREGKSAAETSIGRDVNAAERILQTVPGAVEVLLVVKPDDHLVTLQSKLGSILHAEVVENYQYSLDLVDDHQVKLRSLGDNTIKKEKPDTEYDRVRAKNSHLHGDLNSLEPLSSTPDLSNTGTPKNCGALNFSRPDSLSSVDSRFVVPVSIQSQLNYTAGISGNGDVVRSNASVVNQNVINLDVCHDTALSQNLVDPCNSQVVNSDLSQTCTVVWPHNFLTACNSKVGKPGLSQATASVFSDNVVEQSNTPILNPVLHGIYTDGLSKNFVEPSNSREVHSELCQTSAGDMSGNNCAEPCNSLNTTSGLPEQCSTSTFISGSEQTMHSESNHSDQDDHGAQHPDLLLEADNIDSITGLPQTAMDTDEYIKCVLQAKQLLEHSYSFETRKYRLGFLNTKEDALAPGPTRKHPSKMISGKNTVSRSYITEGGPAESQSVTLEGDVETHLECQYCDFTTSDWDQFSRHMKESHQLNMGDRNPRPSSPSSDVDDDESQSADTSTEDMETIAEELVDQETEQLNEVVNINPNDLIEKETDNERDVYKCKECSYTFRRETAALSHVKMQHLNKEAALYYGKTSRADSEKDVNWESNRGSQSSDESFSLSECSESSETDDEDIESDEESQTNDNNSKFAKTIEDSGTEWLECTLCGDRWATMASLNLHLSSCHNKKRTKGKKKPSPKSGLCDLGGKSCCVSDHKRNRHRSKSQKEADRDYHRSYAKKRRVESSPILCPKHGCKTLLASRYVLAKHIRDVHGPKVKCDICGKLYSNKIHLRRHNEAVHLRVRKYCCTWPDCDKVFSSVWHRKVHMRIHTNEKPLQCELCGFTARQSNSLRYHFEKHHKARSPSSDDKT